MTDRRTYGDSCGIARALDLVGERWALLVTRELLLGPKRFTDLRNGLGKVGPDILSQRLRELERAGVIRRRRLPPPAAASVYELTDWGQELEPVLLALGRWGSRAALGAQPPPLGVDAFAVALKTTFDPGRPAAARAHGSYGLRLGEHDFRLTVADDRFDVTRERAVTPTATIETDPGTLAGVLWHGSEPRDAIAAGALRIDGDQDAVRALFDAFAPPVPA
jgi:DNA-binding HxlR family transcriptional regulator